jgi:hypothetical protein
VTFGVFPFPATGAKGLLFYFVVPALLLGTHRKAITAATIRQARQKMRRERLESIYFLPEDEADIAIETVAIVSADSAALRVLVAFPSIAISPAAHRSYCLRSDGDSQN